MTFSYEPTLPVALEEFLADAANRQEIANAFLASPGTWGLVLKAPLPLDGTVAVLVADDAVGWVEGEREALRTKLAATVQVESFGTVAAWRAELNGTTPLPQFFLDRFERLLSEEGWSRFALSLN
jgi:hypothetical protein